MVRTRLLAAALVAVAVLLPSAALAAEAEIVVDAAHPIDSTSVHYFVRLTGSNGKPAEGATVTATASGPGGALMPATRLEADATEPGVYQGQLTFPEVGTWDIRFSSAEPSASVRYQQALTADAGAAGAGVASAAGDSSGSGGSGAAVAVALAVGLLAVGGAGMGLWARSRRRTPTSAPLDPDPALATSESGPPPPT
jgi:hypothetical protein